MHHALLGIQGGDAQHRTARPAKPFMTMFDQGNDRFPGMSFENSGRFTRGGRGFRPMAQPIHNADKHSIFKGRDDMQVAGLALAGQSPPADAPVDDRGGGSKARRRHYRVHFLMVMTVPFPTSETISNSSI